jgi:cysteine-rich repeat protein
MAAMFTRSCFVLAVPLVMFLGGCGNSAAKCIAGSTEVCACPDQQSGVQTCTSAGRLAACVCAAPTIDAESAAGADDAATNCPDAPAGGGHGDSAGSGGATSTGDSTSADGAGGATTILPDAAAVGGSDGSAGAGGGDGGFVVDAAADQSAATSLPDAPAVGGADGFGGTGGASGSGNSGDSGGNTNSEATIGPEGGQLRSADGRVLLTIPPGALSASSQFYIRPVQSPPDGATGTVYDIGPTGTPFSDVVSISFAVDPTDAADATNGNLQPATYDEITQLWYPLLDLEYDSKGSTLTGWVAHLSLKGLIRPLPQLAKLCKSNLQSTGQVATCGQATYPGATIPLHPASLDVAASYAQLATDAASDPDLHLPASCFSAPACFIDLCDFKNPDDSFAFPRLSPNFTLGEFVQGTAAVSRLVLVSPALISSLESLRTVVGMPVTISSGYRSPAHNSEVGGAEYSQHQWGNAADVQAGSAFVDCLLTEASGEGFGACTAEWTGTFPHLHVDMRASGCGWTCPNPTPVVEASHSVDDVICDGCCDTSLVCHDNRSCAQVIEAAKMCLLCHNPGNCDSSLPQAACDWCGAPCGDGVLETGEGCDDGNASSGDGCSADCSTVEMGWECPVPGVRCFPLCGDGKLIGSEMCDDGNSSSGDGCSNTCQVEPGYGCPTPGKPCTHM